MYSFKANLFCRKTDNKQDQCLIAQEKLHPVCAQRIEGSPQPTCLSLAKDCRESKECRYINKLLKKTILDCFLYFQGAIRALRTILCCR